MSFKIDILESDVRFSDTMGRWRHAVCIYNLKIIFLPLTCSFVASWHKLAPPPISEDDARKGILSLIERGLIPPAAQLTLDPSPVRHKVLMLHDPDNKNSRPISGESSTLGGETCYLNAKGKVPV